MFKICSAFKWWLCWYQAQQMSDDLAYLRGQNQNERLAVPLLHLAGAVQAALAWQHKVCHLTLFGRLSESHRDNASNSDVES